MSDISNDLVERVAAACLQQVGSFNFASAPREWLTPAEAGEYLRLTEKALEHLRAKGGGPAWYKYSGRCRYNLNDLRAWASTQREGQ
jgi:hypothetical protein